MSVVLLSTIVEHIDHICQLAGNANHSCIGSDLDGGYGTEQCPADMDSIADLQSLGTTFVDRGYNWEDVENIMHGNWVRFLNEAW